MSRLLVGLLLMLGCPLQAAEGPRELADVTVRARHILTQHCGGCHGENGQAGRLNVFDHKATTNHAKPVAFAGKKESLILEFVKDGSMPPGDRPRLTPAEIAVLENWLGHDAPEYPAHFNESAAASAVLADWKKLPNPDRAKTRYVSFGHLLEATTTTADLNAVLKQRETLETQLKAAIAGKEPTKSLLPVDACATVFRLDLRGPDWDSADLFQPDGGEWTDRYPMIPFDLIWLENPYVLQLGSQAEEARAAIESMNPHHPRPNPFRPQLYLRGDWLASQLRTGDKPTPLAEELSALTKLAQVKSDPAKQKPLIGPRPRPFSILKSDPPAPVSSWYVRTANSPEALRFTVDATLEGKPLPAKVYLGDAMALAVTVNRAAAVQLATAFPPEEPEGWGIARKKLIAGNEPAADKKTVLSVNDNGTLSLNALGTSHYIVYAAERAFQPVVVRSIHGSEKYPIYRIFPPDASLPVARSILPISVESPPPDKLP